MIAALCAALFAAAPQAAYAQDQKVTVQAGVITAKEGFADIEKQTDLMFVVNHNGFDVETKVSIPGGVMTVDELLKAVFKNTEKSWTIYGKYVIIPVKETPDEEPKEGSIIGTILNSDDNIPVREGAVEIVGKNISAVTDGYGRFSLTGVPAGKYIIKFGGPDFTAVYREVTLAAGQKKSVDVALKPVAIEVVVEIAEVLPEADPIMAPGSYVRPPKEVVMPAPGTYVLTEASAPARSYRPKVALKTNLLYWATTTPNAGLEFYLAERWSFNAHFGYNAWQFAPQKGLKHWVLQPEVRYWFCSVFEQGFIGVHGIYGKFNFKDMNLPFTDVFVGHHYRGSAYGAGIAYGYHLPLGKRFGLELSLGAGFVHVDYEKFRCGSCDEFEGSFSKNYIGPTKASVSLVFLLN